jgi:SNF2 family DNA or RNA helicase
MEFFFDQPRNLLIYERPSELVLQHIPEAKQFNGKYVAIPRTLRNSQVLRWLNYPVAPIITDENYDFPIEPGKSPLLHQKVMANFGVLHPRMFNLSDMGTMKTLATLWAADWLMKQHKDGTFRAIIVAPLSILERVWGNAIFSNFLGRRNFEILYGSAEKRLALLKKSADFFVVNFDGVGVGAHTRKKLELDGFSKALSERDDIRLAIVDEASGYRDSTTKRHRIARQVIGKRQYLWMLTGTPTPNAPTDAYGLAKMVNNAFGKSFTGFREETMMKVSNFVWKPRTGGYDAARRLLTPSIRFDIKQVWDGPELTTQQRQVELTPEQKKLFADLKRDLQVVVKSGQPITAANEAAVRTKFIQISLGGIYDANHTSHAIDAKPRVDELKAVLEQAPAKVLTFVPLTNIVNMLHKELKKYYSCEIVNGSTSQKDRSRIFQAFQERADPRILIADPASMAHGLNLYAAQTVVWFGTTDKTELYLQGNKRAHRPGQKHPVTIVQLVSNKLEQEIYRRLETNTSLQGALLDLVRKGEL